MQAQQELFKYFKTEYPNAFDGAIPPKNTPYPFIYIADTRQQLGESKTREYGYITIIIHIWHDSWKQRGTVSEMMADVLSTAGNLAETANYRWSLIRNETEQQILADNTTNPPLVHGWNSLRYNYSRK